MSRATGLAAKEKRDIVGCPGPESGKGVEIFFMIGCPGRRDWRRSKNETWFTVGCRGPLEVWLGVQGPQLLALLSNTLRITAADALLRLMVGSPGPEAGMVGCPGSTAASTASQHTPDYRSRRAPPAYGWGSRARGWHVRVSRVRGCC